MEIYSLLVYILAYIGLFATTFYSLNLYRRSVKEKNLEATDKSVSIIIPAYNEEKGIARTIESALALDYPAEKLEIIVVDDGSRDNTFKIAKTFESSKNPRVRVFTKKNGGKGSALNHGIKLSRKEIIITMDADSFVHRDALKKMVGKFYNSRVMSVTPSMGVANPRTIWQRVQHIEYYIGVFLRKSFASMNAIHITPGAFSAYRREFFVKYGGYDVGNITEDLEIALRIQSKGYIIENASRAVVYTIAPASFRTLLIQRRRWYTGLIKNLWNYRRLFGLRKGPLGTLVLPVAVLSVTLSVILTSYSIIRTFNNIAQELVNLESINFHFNSFFEANSFLIQRFFFSLFSQPIFLISVLFVCLLAFYMFFSRKQMKYHEDVKINFVIFLLTYSFLFVFWWIVSFTYVLFNKNVIWRGKERH